MDPYIQKFLGKNYLYIGSDASVFFASGSAWHRDVAMRMPVLKLLVYLDFNSHDHSCDFLIIPGSHHIDSAYSSLLQQGLAWPDKPGLSGGLSENGFFPDGSDPTNPCYDHEKDPIPSHSVAVTRGSSIIFDTSAIHGVKSCVAPGKVRRLVTFVFCPNPVDLSNNHYARFSTRGKLTNDYLLEEIYKIKAPEAIRYGTWDYGDELKKYPDYIRRHGIDWSVVKLVADQLDMGLDKEDGSHEQVQAKKIASFLTQNFPNVSGDLLE